MVQYCFVKESSAITYFIDDRYLRFDANTRHIKVYFRNWSLLIKVLVNENLATRKVILSHTKSIEEVTSPLGLYLSSTSLVDTSVKPLKLNLKSPFRVYIWAFHDQRSQSDQRVGEDYEDERLWSDSANQKTEAGALANKSTVLWDSVTANIPVLNQTQSRTFNSSSEARSGMNLCLLFVIKWLFVVMLPLLP